MGAPRCSFGSGTAEHISGLYVYECDFPDIVKSDFLWKQKELMFWRENILKPWLEIKASKLLPIMCKIFNNEKPKFKHKFLIVYANHVW